MLAGRQEASGRIFADGLYTMHVINAKSDLILYFLIYVYVYRI